MYAFVILLALALSLKVVRDLIDEVVPFEVPTAIAHTITVALAAGFAWAIDYSVFTAFGQSLRETWMHPVLTGVTLVAVAEFVPVAVNAIAGRVSQTSGDASTGRAIRAA